MVTVSTAVTAAVEYHRERLFKTREGQLKTEAVSAAETRGIIFIDEFAKLVEDEDNSDDAGSFKSKRRGVQKELLSLIEGTAIQTNKLGRIATDHILFICAGAFSFARPDMMMPELQGRLHTQVTMEKLLKNHFTQIMRTNPFGFIQQQQALLKAAEGIDVVFSECAIDHIAHVAEILNTKLCDTGARRLQNIVTILLEDLKFNAGNFKGQAILFDKQKVIEVLSSNKTLTKTLNNHDNANSNLRKFVI